MSSMRVRAQYSTVCTVRRTVLISSEASD